MRKLLFIALAAMILPYGYGVVPEKEGRTSEAITKDEFVSNASEGNLSKVKELIKKTPWLADKQYGALDGAITAAIDNGHAKVVEYLIKEKYANVDAIKKIDKEVLDINSARVAVRAAQAAQKELTEYIASATAKRGDDKKSENYKRYNNVVKVLEKEQTKLGKLLKEINDKDETYG
jgi:glutathione S-transferase